MHQRIALAIFQDEIADRLIHPARKLESRLVRRKIDLFTIRIVRIGTQPFETHRHIDAAYFKAACFRDAIPAKFYPPRHANGHFHHFMGDIAGRLAAYGLLQHANLNAGGTCRIHIGMPDEYAIFPIRGVQLAKDQLHRVIEGRVFRRCRKIKGDGSACGWKNGRCQ
nr:hypothetical protein [uncultured Janthinobacterium sp.]